APHVDAVLHARRARRLHALGALGGHRRSAGAHGRFLPTTLRIAGRRMKRFLFVVPPLAGHVNPTVSVARRLSARGHRVAWAAHARGVRHLLPEGAEILPLDDEGSDRVAETFASRARGLRGLESLQFLWQELLLPLARGMLPRLVELMTSYA